MKVLLVGSEARAHCIAETLKASSKPIELVCFGSSKNPGILSLTSAYEVGDLSDVSRISEFAKTQHADFAVISPELPLSAGVVDELMRVGVPSIGPTKDMAQLETSKSFTRELLDEYKINSSPQYRYFLDFDGVEDFIDSLQTEFVIKLDGLEGGKGVLVQGDHFDTREEGLKKIKEFLNQDKKVVIEEKLVGQEFSLMSLCDGEHLLHFPAVQDHKRAFADDRGPNTGGMGSYSYPDGGLPFLNDEDIQSARSINQQTATALKKKFGKGYKGVLYGGFMAVKEGIRLIEYNARFGDPEVMNILPVLKNDFVQVCRSVLEGTLDAIKPEFEKVATVCKYVVPKGYPVNPMKGEQIDISEVDQSNVRVFYASVEERGSELVMGASRAIAIVGIDEDITRAEKKVEEEIRKIKGPFYHRDDIGTKALIDKRVKMLAEVRS